MHLNRDYDDGRGEGYGMSTSKRLSVKQLPPQDRPRERLYHVGATGLALPELLAVILGRGTKDASALAEPTL